MNVLFNPPGHTIFGLSIKLPRLRVWSIPKDFSDPDSRHSSFCAIHPKDVYSEF